MSDWESTIYDSVIKKIIMKSGLSISIVIVGYNAGRYLSRCLDSVCAQEYKNFEVIFVDNGSSDDTKDILKLYPDVKTITNKKNMGFCSANNQGIGAASGKWIFTLNSDVILDNGFLSALVMEVKKDESALFGVKILREDRKTIDSTGLVLTRFYRFFDRGNGETDKGQYDHDTEIFGPCAAAALYKREMLESIRCGDEYFDEKFYFMGEDFDLAWRANRKNWKSKFIPDAICYHARNSTKFDDKFRQYLSFRNRFYLLIKNHDINLQYIPVLLLYDIPRALYMLCTNKYTFRAMCEVVRDAPVMFKKGKI